MSPGNGTRGGASPAAATDKAGGFGAATDPAAAETPTFATFVVGRGNRLAYAAAKGVAESPSGDYNPLLLHGPDGLGKTHLLAAVEAHVRDAHRGSRVRRAAAGLLVRELLRDPHAALRDAGGGLDLLLVDDLDQVLASGPPPPEALRAVERLLASARQVVVAADRPPDALAGLGRRALARLRDGLVVELEPPDAETRAAILRLKLRSRGVDPVPEVVEELARRAFGSVRDLERAADELVALSAAGPLAARDVVLRLGDRLPAREAHEPGVEDGRRVAAVEARAPAAAAAPLHAGTEGRSRAAVPPPAGDSPFDDPDRVFLEWMPLEDRLVDWPR